MTDNDQQKRFVVTAKEGWKFHDDRLFKDMFIPFCTEFNAFRIDDQHILYNANVLPTINDNKIVIMEKECVNDMLWKVVSKHTHIDFYKDSALTDYSYTFYANSEIIVEECSNGPDGKLFKAWEHNLYFSIPFSFESHMVPMNNLILGRISNTDGVLLRKTKEIYSDVIGLLPFNTHVIIQNKLFSDIPSNKNLKRLQLFNNMGWINAVSNYDGFPNVEIISLCKNPFQYSTTVIKLDQSPFQDFSTPKVNIHSPELCIICLQNERTVAVTHESYGHMLYCITCADIMSERNEKCPLCRTEVVQYVRMY